MVNNNMTEEVLPELPKELERYVTKPYGGLFGNSVQIQVVEEIVADPYSDYRPKDLEEMTGASAPSIRRVLNNLTTLGLLIKDSRDAQHPVYRPNLESKKIVALTFLAYALVDDRKGSEYMDSAILEYYFRELRPRFDVLAVATATRYHYHGRTWDEGSYNATAQTMETGDKKFILFAKEV
jgi:hypothetical protein